MPLGWLSTFLAIVPGWAVDVLTKDEFDVAKPRASAEPQRQDVTSNQQLLGVAVPAVYNASADEKGGMFINASAPL